MTVLPKPKRCSHCGQPLDKTPVRWCRKCKRPIARHDKYRIMRNGLEHRHCEDAENYVKSVSR
jgi:predicted amidophosphoribosyltransferase